MEPEPRLLDVVREQKYPLVFVTISGAHLYGFPSPDSDYDLRGVHVLPVREVVGLETSKETIEFSGTRGGAKLDLVTHDLKKFCRLLLKKNGYVLEQLYSPLVVHTTPEHAELKEIARVCITRHHSHHYLGFAETQWELLMKEDLRKIKPLLYVYRVLLTGIHLMRTGEVEADLETLSGIYSLPHVAELVSRKRQAGEQSPIVEGDMAFYHREYVRLRAELELASQVSALPETPAGREALNKLLIRIRMRAS